MYFNFVTFTYFPIISFLQDFFDLNKFKDDDPIRWSRIQLGINADCQRRYTSRKSKFKIHFEENGGYDDVETAKKCPPENYDVGKWVKLIDDLFMDPKYRLRCKANKNNRAKQRYPSFQGSQSFAQIQHISVRKIVNITQRSINFHIEI